MDEIIEYLESGDRLMTALELDAREIDDKEMDGTDYAHPAYWRGNDDGVRGAVDSIRKVIDTESCEGVVGDPKLEQLRRDVLELITERNKLKDKTEYLQDCIEMMRDATGSYNG